MSLLGYLPEQYRNSPEIAEAQLAFGKWCGRLHSDREDLFDQFYIDSATWGLKAWEAALALETDVSKPYEFRHSRIKSKLRGAGTATKALIKHVAESFTNGEVEVIEHFSIYTFEVKFVGRVGTPPNIDDLTAAIEEIKPAHLAFYYTYIFVRWMDVAHLRWMDVAHLTWKGIKEGEHENNG